MATEYKCDLHIHSNFSDGRLSISEVVDLYGQQGFHAIAITDHLCERTGLIGAVTHGLNYTLSRSCFNTYIQTIRSEAQRAQQEYNMLVVPGFEITKNSLINHRSAHILVLGVEHFIDPELPVPEILKLAKLYGGLTVAAHPFHTGEFEFQTFYLWSRRNQLKDLIDAWEVNYRQRICDDVLNSGLPLIANSDFHRIKHFKSWKTSIPSDLTQDSLFQSIRSQKIDFFLDS